MNYAAMIEEKHLKKGFIIATLISTVIGTFTTSMGLYERVRDRHIQHKKDHGQDEKIKELERRADAADRKRLRAEREKEDHIKGSGRRSRALGWDERDLLEELAASGPMIRREYDRNYARFGSRFAEGDPIAQNELQAQVIEMQAHVIRLLQEALVNGTMPDPAALYAAAGRARNGSIRALNDQYQRMLTAAPISKRNGTIYIPGSNNAGTGRRALRSSSVASASTRSSYGEPVDRDRRQFIRDGRDYADDEDDRDFRRRDGDRQRRSMSQATGGTRRASTFPVQPPPAITPSPRAADLSSIVASQPPLFCRYSVQLQKDWRRPLALGSDDGGSSGRSHYSELDFDGKNGDGDLVCPACMGSFAIEHDRSWKMHKPVVVGEEVQEIKETDVQDDGVDKDETTAGHDGDHADKVVTRRKNVVEIVQDRLFVVSNRFIVKCHRPAAYDGLENTLLPPSYACSLCDQFDTDGKVTLCSTMARLVSHVCEKHSVGELLSDPDIREIRR